MLVVYKVRTYFILGVLVLITFPLLSSCGSLQNSDVSAADVTSIYLKFEKSPESADSYVVMVSVPSTNENFKACVNSTIYACIANSGISGATFVNTTNGRTILKLNSILNLSTVTNIVLARDSGITRLLNIIRQSTDYTFETVSLTKKNHVTNSKWGSVWTDIANYVTEAEIKSYGSPHEITHKINSDLRNKNYLGKPTNGFYLLNGKGVVLEEPNVKKSSVTRYIPQRLRNYPNAGGANSYDLYIIGQKAFENLPLNIWDEWSAYINGIEAEVNTYEEKGELAGNTYRAALFEFMLYSTALIMSVAENDTQYFNSNSKFKAVYKYQMQRSVNLANRLFNTNAFDIQNMKAYFNQIRTSSDTQDMRNFLKIHFGANWVEGSLGF